jgi:hypothetical protein
MFLFRSLSNVKAVMSNLPTRITGSLSIGCRRFTSFCWLWQRRICLRGVFDFSPHLAEPPLRAGAEYLVAAMAIEAGRIPNHDRSEM